MFFGYLCLVVAVFTAVPRSAVGNVEAMSHVTAHFGKALLECREESGLSEDILEEFHHFWRKDFEIVHRELGCAIICMSKKHNLMHDDARLHHDNMHDYVKNFPNGELLAKRMVGLLYDCQQQYDEIQDNCSRVMKMAACFKQRAFEEGLAPEVDMVESVVGLY